MNQAVSASERRSGHDVRIEPKGQRCGGWKWQCGAGESVSVRCAGGGACVWPAGLVCADYIDVGLRTFINTLWESEGTSHLYRLVVRGIINLCLLDYNVARTSSRTIVDLSQKAANFFHQGSRTLHNGALNDEYNYLVTERSCMELLWRPYRAFNDPVEFISPRI